MKARLANEASRRSVAARVDSRTIVEALRMCSFDTEDGLTSADPRDAKARQGVGALSFGAILPFRHMLAASRQSGS